MKFTHFLKDLTSKDVLIAGGKGASLGEMIHAGIPVPGGFVVSSDTFDYFLDKTGLNVQIEAILNTVNHKTISSVEEASESIQSLILSFPMPEEIEHEIYNSFDSEKLSFVAVRSSATAEDGANHAWAGQLDSYLNTTRDNLIEKVRSCWASLFTPRAIFYRFEKELHEDHISVAVVVQKMVQSETSGIAFSVHPVTQDRNQMIIEAGYGLGEAIVSGAVTPDNYVVRKNDMKIESINVNHQQKALYKSENGGNEWVDLGEKGKNQILTKEQISELAQIIITIENHYTFPCDIEWTYEGGEFFVVQSRPITTLLGLDQNSTSNTPGAELLSEKWIHNAAGGHVRGPVLNQSLFIFGSGYNQEKYGYNKIFGVDKRYEILNIFDGKDLRSYLCEETVKAYAIKALHNKFDDVGIYQKVIDTFLSYNNLIQEHYDNNKYAILSHKSDEELIETLHQSINLIRETNAYSHFSVLFSKEDLKIFYKEKFHSDIVLSEEDWDRLFIMIKPSFDVQQQLDLYKNQYNNAGVYEVEELQYFTASYAGIKPLNTVRDYIQEHFDVAKNANEAGVHMANLLNKFANLENEFVLWKNNLSENITLIADYLQDAMFVRDQRKNLFNKGIVVARHCVEILFERYGIEKELIPYCMPQEIVNGKDLSQLRNELIKRKTEGCIVYVPHEGNIEISYSKIKIELENIETYRKIKNNIDKHDIITGSIAVKGKLSGIVKVVTGIQYFSKFNEGEILVCGMTRPEYVPLMKKAIAVITDEGGITCHAAIVSRELGIPCVIGTKIATQLLKDGDLVEVDADNGVVRILEKKTDNIYRGGKQWIPAITRNMSFFHEYLTLLGHYHNSKDFGIDVAQQQLAYTKEGSKTTAFINIDEMKRYSSAVLDAVSTPDKVQLLVNAYENHATTLLESLEILTKDINVKNWTNFCDNYQRFCAGLNITVVIGRGGGDKLAAMLKEKGFGENEVADIVGKITYPQSSTPLFSSQLDLLQIGAKIQKEGLGEKETEKLLAGWLNTYGHIPVNYCEEPWNMDDARTQLQSLMQEDCTEKYKEYIQSHEQKISDAQKLLNEIKDENIANLAYAIAQGTYLNEYRKNKFSLVSLLYRPVFSRIAKKCGSDNWRDVFYMTPSEITAIVDGELFDMSACIKNRQDICYTVSDDGKIVFTDSDFVVSTKAYLDALHGTSNTKNTNQDNNSIELKGYSANKGKITAIAKVILNSKDFGKINRGEILVTTMTSVDFVPIMEKAGAFVTNEGGITSHASIVAREMNKPCIIGTQNATAIIKDGDLVEVDADNGVVRIIKKNGLFPDDYMLSFRASGLTPLMTDICRDMYVALKVLYIVEKGVMKQYFRNDAFQQALDYGVEFYGSKTLFDSYYNDVKKLISDFSLFFDTTIKGKNNIDRDDAKLFMEYSVTLCTLYSKMDFEYTDKAFILKDSNSIIAENLQIISTFKDEVRAFMNTVFFEPGGYLEIFTEVLGRQFNIAINDINACIQKEILDLYQGTIIDNAILRQREELFVADSDSVAYPYYWGEGAKEISSRFIEKVIASDTISGTIANKGKVQGVVRVIPVDYSDFDKINAAIDNMHQGDILVAETTAPELIVACKKAGAIITDMGGMMSHAAIVSREFGIPCIVGTKNASQILKTGDFVEVDADNGVVKILQEAPLIVPRPLDEFYRFELSMWTATNYFHMGVAPTLKINDERLCGTCYIQYNYDKPSIAIIEKSHLLEPGKKYLSYLEHTDSEFANIVYTNYSKIISLADKLQVLHIKQVKDNAIIDISEYFDEYKSLFPWVIGVGYCIDMALEEYAKEHDIDLHSIGHVGESFITKERRDLAAIATITDQDKLHERIKEHSYKWSFLLNNYTGYHPVSEEYFINRFEEVKSNQFGEIISIKKPTSINEWIAFCTYIRDERKRCNMLFNGLYVEYLRRECEKLHLNFADAVLMTPEEFEQNKNTGIPQYNGTRNVFASHNGFQNISLDDWNNIISIEVGNNKSVAGICASKGKITGIARIILESKDFDKLQPGEIIIASMTRPDFAPILPRAGGIITNEGGVTCHAAIVSRELGVPCLISTGNGTKIIQDGDMIELDATNGVARIIS